MPNWKMGRDGNARMSPNSLRNPAISQIAGAENGGLKTRSAERSLGHFTSATLCLQVHKARPQDRRRTH